SGHATIHRHGDLLGDRHRNLAASGLCHHAAGRDRNLLDALLGDVGASGHGDSLDPLLRYVRAGTNLVGLDALLGDVGAGGHGDSLDPLLRYVRAGTNLVGLDPFLGDVGASGHGNLLDPFLANIATGRHWHLPDHRFHHI